MMIADYRSTGLHRHTAPAPVNKALPIEHGRSFPSAAWLAASGEGMETDEQLLLISAVETVDEVQSYLFAPPLPAPAIRKLLRAAPVEIEKCGLIAAVCGSISEQFACHEIGRAGHRQ